jgi:hypothetical protein
MPMFRALCIMCIIIMSVSLKDKSTRVCRALTILFEYRTTSRYRWPKMFYCTLYFAGPGEIMTTLAPSHVYECIEQSFQYFSFISS